VILRDLESSLETLFSYASVVKNGNDVGVWTRERKCNKVVWPENISSYLQKVACNLHDYRGVVKLLLKAVTVVD
jgi:hypothetical protein